MVTWQVFVVLIVIFFLITYIRINHTHSQYHNAGMKWKYLIIDFESKTCKKQLRVLGEYKDFFHIVTLKQAITTYRLNKPKAVPCWIDQSGRYKYGIKQLYELV